MYPPPTIFKYTQLHIDVHIHPKANIIMLILRCRTKNNTCGLTTLKDVFITLSRLKNVFVYKCFWILLANNKYSATIYLYQSATIYLYQSPYIYINHHISISISHHISISIKIITKFVLNIKMIFELFKYKFYSLF